ncbi:MAG: ATP-binding cassette domain-containing protein [Bacteroidota bacterium]
MSNREISCRNLTIQFKRDQEPVLRDIDLKIPSNSVVLLYGGTGKGKTSLFNVLSGLNFSGASGEIYWDGELIQSSGNAHKLRPEYISLIYSHFYFLQSLDVKENILLPAVFAGKSKKEINNRLNLLGEIFNFDDNITGELNFYRKILYSRDMDKGINPGARRLKRPNKITSLSNGQKEIVNIARALILDTPFIFADELLRSYSDAEAEIVWRRLLDPRLGIKKNKTLFMITRKDYFRKDPNVDLIYEITGQTVRVSQE